MPAAARDVMPRQAQVDAERAAVTLESSGQAITPAMLGKFARTACERMQIDGGGARSSILKWRRGWDSNPRSPRRDAGFQDRCNQPLCHLSEVRRLPAWVAQGHPSL